MSNIVDSYRAYQVSETEEGKFTGNVVNLPMPDCGEGEVLIRVRFSAVNYKDALSANGNKGVTRNYPHVPGVDASGEVLVSGDSAFEVGDKVVVTGHDLGMNTSGGYGQVIKVPADWVHVLPEGVDLASAAALGTAGITAALCIDKLLKAGIHKASGPVLVTGATGGVSSVAIAMLAQMGFEVHALTGKREQVEALTQLGVSEVVGREVLTDENPRPMLKPLWAAAIDTLGGNPLANLLKLIKPEGAVSACGLVAGTELNSTVFPFILRGVSLLGVDSVEIPRARKREMWQLISDNKNFLSVYKPWIKEVTLDELDQALDTVLKGRAVGRYLVNLD